MIETDFTDNILGEIVPKENLGCWKTLGLLINLLKNLCIFVAAQLSLL